MEGVVGVFRSRTSAQDAWRELSSLGQPEASMILLTPETSDETIARVPSTPAEAPGIGKSITEVVGAAIGGGAGLAAGSALASLFVPGVGPILAAGIGAGALFGFGGAVAGAKLGEESERTLDQGLPEDDLLVMKRLLRDGRTVLVVNVNSPEGDEQARAVMTRHGSEKFEDVGRHLGDTAA
jgi:hypothetical protein